jgi:hypothetical protein
MTDMTKDLDQDRAGGGSGRWSWPSRRSCFSSGMCGRAGLRVGRSRRRGGPVGASTLGVVATVASFVVAACFLILFTTFTGRR